jgi:cell shape-determining protein MreC
VDHSYDLELDPVRRIELVTNQIEKICKLTNLNDIRQQLKSRFLKNIATLKSYTNYQSELPQWKKIFFG